MKIALLSSALCLRLLACSRTESDSTTIEGVSSAFGFPPEARLDVSGTQCQIVGDNDTRYKNMQEATNGVILWHLGSRYRVKGIVLGHPTNENGFVIVDVTLMKASVIEHLPK
jgi:hypothetical protein